MCPSEIPHCHSDLLYCRNLTSVCLAFIDQPSSHLEDPYAEEVEPCLLCKTNIPVSYKNPKLLSQFVSPNTGRIYSRQITRLCQMQQDRITKAINLSRVHGFMPVMYRETYFLKDPIFDVKYTGNADIGEHIKFPGPNSSGESPITMVNKKSFADKTKARKREKPKLTKTEKRKNKAR
ncbi:putative 28S ribosomal protein S18c, mitochondrial [Apostichopus japonicus]|uniref:Putative 28S ribosomal protein S18c, mitochondrial n=1 Tax=Stichopus japonicus TaxID=307972 RepID=A0A2G8L5E4_STIJA|nr:putative 28S ribosomal protein S18c, mitochondrial [Apostichopus japonicus]